MSYSNYDLNSKVNYLNSVITTTIPVINSKISSLQVPANHNELVVVDTVIVADAYPTPNYTTTTRPTDITVLDNNNPAINSVYGIGGVSNFYNTYSSFFDYQLLRFFAGVGTDEVFLNASYLQFTDGITTSKLDKNNWTGNINSVNTSVNATHYLAFHDSSATGYGKPQKTAGLFCNPSTNTITATTFSGSLTGNSSSSSSISLTSDDTAGTYFLPFSKTVASNSALFVDNSITPLTYNPNTSTLTATNFSGNSSSSSSISLTSDDTAGTYYIPFSKTTTATGNALYIDNVTTPLTYSPNTGVLTSTQLNSATIATPTSSSACVLWNSITTGSITMMNSQTTGSINIGSLSATTGLVNIRTGLVCSRQIQTTNSTTYPPNVVTHLGYNIQTLGASFTNTALLASTNTNLFSYAFTSANYGTYLFTAIVALSPNDNTVSRQLILAIGQTSASITNTPFIDQAYSTPTVGFPYLKVQATYQIYSGTPTVYLVGFSSGTASTVQTASSLSHFTYTRIA